MKKVSILLSLYKPKKEYLIQLLESLNNQTYKDIELLVFDDCVTDRTPQELILDNTNIETSFLPYSDKNKGYVKAFETLVSKATGYYIAFCDQDDIWEPNKIEIAVSQMLKDKSILSICDRSIIDENSSIVENHVKINDHNVTLDNSIDIVKYDIFTTIAPGMSLIARTDEALKWIPFSNNTGHDKWIIACAGIAGKISFIHQPLTQYRRHSNNVTGSLYGIENKKDYYQKRVNSHDRLVKEFINKYPDYKDKEEVLSFSEARVKKSLRGLIKYRYLAPRFVKFEILLKFTPSIMFKFIKRITQKISN